MYPNIIIDTPESYSTSKIKLLNIVNPLTYFFHKKEHQNYSKFRELKYTRERPFWSDSWDNGKINNSTNLARMVNLFSYYKT